MRMDIVRSAATEEHETPLEIYAPIHARYRFDLDVCATEYNAKCVRYFTKEQNGLLQDWAGRVWMNPPYGRDIGLWLNKTSAEVQLGRAELVVALLPARTDTRWWDQVWDMASAITFISGRVRFGDARDAAPFPSALALFDGWRARHPGSSPRVGRWDCRRRRLHLDTEVQAIGTLAAKVDSIFPAAEGVDDPPADHRAAAPNILGGVRPTLFIGFGKKKSSLVLACERCGCELRPTAALPASRNQKARVPSGAPVLQGGSRTPRGERNRPSTAAGSGTDLLGTPNPEAPDPRQLDWVSDQEIAVAPG